MPFLIWVFEIDSEFGILAVVETNLISSFIWVLEQVPILSVIWFIGILSICSLIWLEIASVFVLIDVAQASSAIVISSKIIMILTVVILPSF